eukprot:CAMPEP_0198208320 /NCGR_PEP_ID=MMETSP1445-20131203/11696_1 /TAXON_ID=36898 /ORGANISM="Pyramimonas sp., Strain CCMP2087" /LENGTH=163 /DNA_ID=CAMNT_0043881671 /DNA_START=106 /DNA_END=594 /DNA_ORIENTATION=+
MSPLEMDRWLCPFCLRDSQVSTSTAKATPFPSRKPALSETTDAFRANEPQASDQDGAQLASEETTQALKEQMSRSLKEQVKNKDKDKDTDKPARTRGLKGHTPRTAPASGTEAATLAVPETASGKEAASEAVAVPETVPGTEPEIAPQTVVVSEAEAVPETMS